MDRHTAQILKGIKDIPVDDIARFISDGVITRAQAIDAGLSPQRLAELDRRRNVLEEERKKEEERKVMQTVREESAKALIERIANNNIEAFKIKESLDQGLISKEDIKNALGSDNEAGVQRLINYRKKTIIYDPAPPAPRPNATDAFFIGIPRSGKSCILASLFYYIDKKGIIENYAHNPEGTKYRNQLRQEFELGYLPHSTAESAADDKGNKRFISTHMSLGLSNELHGSVHELNLYDMSGEFVNRTYKTGKGPGTLFNAGHINSENRKLLFFVVDYDLNNDSKTADDGTQSDKLLCALTLLESEGILDKCDGIYLLVSKADRFPIGKNDGSTAYYSALRTHTREFLESEFKTFATTCKKLRERYRNQFNVTVYPYSIGEVRYGDVLWSRNDRAPEFIVDMILNHAMYKREGVLDRLGMAQR